VLAVGVKGGIVDGRDLVVGERKGHLPVSVGDHQLPAGVIGWKYNNQRPKHSRCFESIAMRQEKGSRIIYQELVQLSPD